MDTTHLWTDDPEDQDLPDDIKTRVEVLLADPAFLAWMDQQDALLHHQKHAGTCP
jgi:hypothetical protein